MRLKVAKKLLIFLTDYSVNWKELVFLEGKLLVFFEFEPGELRRNCLIFGQISVFHALEQKVFPVFPGTGQSMTSWVEEGRKKTLNTVHSTKLFITYIGQNQNKI